MKTLVIPDIHCKWQKADSILKRYQKDVDEIVLLGDYFDDFGDSPKLNGRTAQWLKEEVLHKENIIVLLGNHEFNYLYDMYIDKCSGYTSKKNWRINHVLTSKDWAAMKPFHWAQGWLCTHAGVHRDLHTHPVLGFKRDIFNTKVEEDLNKTIHIKCPTHSFRVGQARGGPKAFGGITWCDYDLEFKPIPGVKQIFGHTPGTIIKSDDLDNWCIDTHLKHVAIIEDEHLTIKEA